VILKCQDKGLLFWLLLRMCDKNYATAYHFWRRNEKVAQ
jgi:hypothetical protein